MCRVFCRDMPLYSSKLLRGSKNVKFAVLCMMLKDLAAIVTELVKSTVNKKFAQVCNSLVSSYCTELWHI